MAATFEQTVAMLVENRIASEHPNLAPYRKGFVLLDFDESKQTAFGLYRLLIGTVPALMPAVYRAGDLSGLDILILRDLPLFVPAIDSWINLVADSGIQELGELLPPGAGRGKGPSGVVIDLRSFPYALKTAASQLTAAENRALRSALQYPDREAVQALHRAMTESPLEGWMEEWPKAGALVAKAAESDETLAERLDLAHGDGFSARIRRFVPQVCRDLDALNVRRAAAEPEAKLQVIRDIGDPAAALLRPSEKRILLRTGQFIVDHRAEAETSIVVRSPESNVYQTCPGAGRWRVLLADASMADAETFLPDESAGSTCCGPAPGSPTLPEVWVVPADGSAPFLHHTGGLYLRPPAAPAGDTAGKEASREAMLSCMEESGKLRHGGEPCTAGDTADREGCVLATCRGRAVHLNASCPRDSDAPAEANGRQVVFTGTPGRIRVLDDRIVIPSDARLHAVAPLWSQKPTLPLGAPEDVRGRIRALEDVRDLSVEVRDGQVHISGAVKRRACSESEAMLELAASAGIPARTAASMVRDAFSRPEEVHRYLLRAASFRDETEDDALASIQRANPAEIRQTMSQDDLEHGGNRVAAGVADAPDDSLDSDVIRQVLSLADFREITAESVRRFSSAMDEAGRQLLRTLVHRDRYEEVYGDDARRMETTVREAFVKNGELALFLREKRGADGMPDAGEALAGLLTEDMG